MNLYDEEITDILTEHGVRMLKGIAIAFIVCVGLSLCVCWIPAIWIPAIQATTIPSVVRGATAAARQAGVSVAAATRDAWVETTTELTAQDASRP